MAIVGVVLRLAGSYEAQTEVRARLRADTRVSCGPAIHDRIALTIEARTDEVGAWLEDLGRWPGVLLVSPVFHEFEDELPEAGAGPA
jgi:hypothetical protein